VSVFGILYVDLSWLSVSVSTDKFVHVGCLMSGICVSLCHGVCRCHMSVSFVVCDTCVGCVGVSVSACRCLWCLWSFAGVCVGVIDRVVCIRCHGSNLCRCLCLYVGMSVPLCQYLWYLCLVSMSPVSMSIYLCQLSMVLSCGIYMLCMKMMDSDLRPSPVSIMVSTSCRYAYVPKFTAIHVVLCLSLLCRYHINAIYLCPVSLAMSRYLCHCYRVNK
jgi:hypothetical protein